MPFCFNPIDCVFYEEVQHGEDHFAIGDVVELCASGKQPSLEGDYKVSGEEGSDKETSWIAEIDALWEDEHGEKMMECRWYYGINDMSASARPPYRKR